MNSMEITIGTITYLPEQGIIRGFGWERRRSSAEVADEITKTPRRIPPPEINAYQPMSHWSGTYVPCQLPWWTPADPTVAWLINAEVIAILE